MRLNVSDNICDGNKLPYGFGSGQAVYGCGITVYFASASVYVEDKLYRCCEARRFSVATALRKANSSVMFRFE